jgi:hypothetical protein
MNIDMFLNSIKEDLTSIGVFADWLEEQKDERASILRSIKDNSIILTIGDEPVVVIERYLYTFVYNLFHPFEINARNRTHRDRIIPWRKDAWSKDAIDRWISLMIHNIRTLDALLINSVGITLTNESYCRLHACTEMNIKQVPYWCTKK